MIFGIRRMKMNSNNNMTIEMTIETLRKSMREFLEVHGYYLIDMFIDENPDITEEEAIEKALDDIVTEKVLKYINEHMRVLPVVELTVGDEHVTDGVMNMEFDIGHGITYIDKMFNKPVCLIGYSLGMGGVNNFYSCSNSCLVFLSADGEWKYLEADIISGNDCQLTIYKESNDEYHGLELLRDVIPETYDGMLYDFE